jgi:hypothetical protein
MNSNDTSDHTTPAFSTRDHNQPKIWQAATSPFLRYANMRTLALLMFVGFAVLNTTHGKDADTKESALTGTNKIEIVDRTHNEATHVATEPAGRATSEGSILWQFVGNIFNVVTNALNDPSLIDYARQQGIETSDSLTTLRSNASSHSATRSEPALTQSITPSTH